MKVVVTGAGGYLGSCVTSQLLRAGLEVVGVDSLFFGNQGIASVYGDSNFRFVKFDLSDSKDSLDKIVSNTDIVVHLAAIVGEKLCKQYPDIAVKTNLEATKSLVSACKKSSVKFIFASTCSNYGVRDMKETADEESQVSPTSLYSETKVKGEKFILDQQTDGFNSLILRFATLCGISPMMRFDLLLNELVIDAISTHKLRIIRPEVWRPFLNVRDAADAVCQFINLKSAQGIYNVGVDTNNITKAGLALLVANQVEGTRIETLQGSQGERDYRVSFSKIARAIDSKHWRSLQECVTEVKGALDSGAVSMSKEYRIVSGHSS